MIWFQRLACTGEVEKGSAEDNCPRPIMGRSKERLSILFIKLKHNDIYFMKELINIC